MAMEKLRTLTKPAAFTLKSFTSWLARGKRPQSPLEALQEALDRQQLKPFFQPVMYARSRELAGCEVLMRWKHPQMGIIPPEQFIPLAESSGLIIPMTQQLLVQVRDILSAVSSKLPDNFHVGINITPEHFSQAHFVEECQSFLSAFPPLAIKLVLELTERGKISISDTMKTQINALKHEGVRLALDDFGTGYATHSYLQSFPVDFIKIDKSFVHMLNVDEISGHIVENVIDLAMKLNLSVVAEGVENEEQAAFLLSKGVEFLQGYLFSAPLAKGLFIAKYLTVTR